MAELRLQDGAGASSSGQQQKAPQQQQRRPYSEYRLEADLAAELERAEAGQAAAAGNSSRYCVYSLHVVALKVLNMLERLHSRSHSTSRRRQAFGATQDCLVYAIHGSGLCLPGGKFRLHLVVLRHVDAGKSTNGY